MKIFISAPRPMSKELIAEIEQFVNTNTSLNVSGKIQYHDWEEDNQTAWIELHDDVDPNKDEATVFILAIDDFGDLQCFNGEPKCENGEWVNIL